MVKILSLRKKIIDLYCETENDENCKLSDTNFLQDVVFLGDIMSKKNVLYFTIGCQKNSSFYLENCFFQVTTNKVKTFREINFSS